MEKVDMFFYMSTFILPVHLYKSIEYLEKTSEKIIKNKDCKNQVKPLLSQIRKKSCYILKNYSDYFTEVETLKPLHEKISEISIIDLRSFNKSINIIEKHYKQ